MVAGFVILVLVAASNVGRPLVAQEPKADGGTKSPELDQVSELIESVGMLGGLNLYQAYLNIGFIADGKSQGIYADDDAAELLGSVLTPLESMTEQFDKAAKISGSKDDKATIVRVTKAAGMLKTQGQNLVTFWNSGKEADGNRYEASRKQTWTELSDLLGLKKLPSASESK
jgi:hypothetical protein